MALPLSLMSAPAIAQGLTPPSAPKPPSPATSTATTSSPSAPVTPTDKALAQAKKDKRRVEIESLRSESATYYANPDGKTIRMELHTQPIRVKNADGKGFTPVDTTLVEVDGAIKPKAAKANLVLSVGRDKTLLRSRAADATAKITTPSELPKPRLKGDSATYPGAYGRGRDLVVTASPTGFRQQITIAERPTGPISFQVPLDLPQGMSFTKNTAGRPTIAGKDGKALTEVRPTLLRDAKAADADSPLDAGRIGKAAVTLAEDGKTLVFTPDAAFLADPATTYPVTMTAAASDWWEGHTGQWSLGAMDTWINDVDYRDSWDTHAQDQIVVGKSYASSVAKRWRGYLKFPDIPTEFAGSTVQNADLVLWNYQSNECGISVGSGITARQITSAWDDLTLSWNSQPSVTGVGADTEYGAYSEDCNYAWDLTHSINGIVQEWVNGATNYGIQLTAGNESELRNWRRYRSEDAGGCTTSPLEACKGQLHPPILTVDFELPEPPRRERVVISSPTLLGTFPEYEEAVQQSVFSPESPADIETVGLTPAVADKLEAKRGGEPYFVGSDMLDVVEPVPSGDEPTDPEGEDVFAPRALTHDPAVDANEVPLDADVRVTFSEPVADTAITMTSSQETAVEGTLATDATEKTVTFTPQRPLNPGTTYTVAVTSAVDSWENVMVPYTWSFHTVEQAAARWTFNEGNGRTAADSSGQGHDAALNDTAAWIPGKTGNAISNTPTQAQATASREALRQGKTVEVVDRTTATSVTYAQPDGRTFMTEIAAGPVRTKRDGVWVPIDTALVEQGGTFKPKAIDAEVDVEVSTGGSGEFVRMTADGRRYALTWPAVLPKPTVKGNVATYTDAAGKGADLVVTVLPTGFRHDVVLRERPDEPVELRIGVETGGLTLVEGKGGRLLLTDTTTGKNKGKAGRLVASAPQPVMWDADARGRLVKGKRSTARHAKITTDVVVKDGRTELVLKPDQAFLTDPATVYPVRIDPATTLPFNHDVELADTNDAGFPADPTTQYLMAGRMYGLFLSRVYLRFNTASLTGSTVTDAKLSLHNIDAPSCGTQVGAGIQARRVTGAWDENTLQWANKPASTTEDAQTNRQAFTQDCGAARMEWTVTGIAQDWAGGAANHGLVLQHPNEANTADNYRVFTSSEDTDDNAPPTLTVTTTGPASAPTATALAITPAQANGGTTTVTSLTPQLSATVTDAAPGSLTGGFEIEHDPAAPAGQGTGQIWTATSTPIVSGSQATVTVPAAKLADGWKVRWRARAANTTAATTSAWSAWQSATVDVPNPTVSALQVTPSEQVNGTTVATSLTPNLHAVVTDPAAQPLRAEVEVEHDPAAPAGQGSGQIWAGAVNGVASGSQASIAVPANTLTDGWKMRWRARAVNTATTVGSPWSDWQALTVDVPDPVSEPAVGALQVTPSEQVDDTTVTSSLTPGLLAQVSDPAGGTLRAEVEIEHDPAAPAGQGTGQIWTGGADNVPAGTQASIAIPANTLTDGWKVRWRARAVSPTAASAWSNWQSLAVGVPKPTVQGLMITPSKVVDNATVTTTLTPALKVTVTHPTGQALRAEAEVEHDPAAPAGQGSGQIWVGGLDNITSGTQAALTVPADKLTDGWKVRWRARAVTGQVSSAWSGWQQVTVDVTQPGEESLAQTTGPVIRTDESFTAAAWLRWSDKDGDYTVLEQKGTHQAPFRLGNTPDHGLVFTFTSADATEATVEGVLTDVEPPVNEWFHLAGVYDAMGKVATVYLNGTPIGTTQLTSSPWNSGAPLQIGSSMLGAIDEVDVYQRVLSSADVGDLYARGADVSAQKTIEPKAATLAAPPEYNFDYGHINLQNCKDTNATDKHRLARIQEKPYVSCWSAYLYVKEFEEDATTRTMEGASLNGGIIKRLKKALPLVDFDDDDRFRFRATWVMHSYVGDTTGNNILKPSEEELKPQDIKVWVRIDEMAVETETGAVRIPSAQLRDLQIGLRLEAKTDAWWGKECKIRSGIPTQILDVSSWHKKPDSEFIVRAMRPDDPTRNNWCSILPQVEIRDDPLTPTTFYLWSQRVTDENGDDRGVRRKGDLDNTDDGNENVAPTFRCDWKSFGFSTGKRVGGCVNYSASRVFVMSRSKDTLFPEVVDHIGDALNPDTNAATFPPLRDGHDWENPTEPPARLPANGKRKDIPGNWDQEESDPLVRTESEAEANVNRHYFSKRDLVLDARTTYERFWPNTVGTNYCKYYMPEKYRTWPGGGIPAGIGNSCDEYPFASTVQGAANAKGHFSLRALNHQQNVDHGHVLRSFYAHYRVGANNQFWVSIIP
ncbi:DNRLRE domain-containing protein [Streptosporangium saharense]|uniref:DNRLRE domain-containing protein n=1 Tax=Streptosporangium saharense TaxID=1706840 RepID=UPI00332806A5